MIQRIQTFYLFLIAALIGVMFFAPLAWFAGEVGMFELHAFALETADGETVVQFTFDTTGLVDSTEIVAFESLSREGIELAAHANIEDPAQTVKVTVTGPRIGTKATIDGKKETVPAKSITIDDMVSYKNLTPGKEYRLVGVLMDKSTGNPFKVGDQEIRSEITFTPEKADGETVVKFTFDGSGITQATEIVVFEVLYQGEVEIAAHEDIFKSMDEAVLIVDADGGFLEANDKAKELFQSLGRFKRGERVCQENLKEVFDVNTYFEHISGNHIFEVHANKIWNNRVLVGYSIVFVDMTQSRKQLEQMKVLKANAENANRAKSEFLARMSHEIRTPINAVLGMNEMVLRESTEEDVKKYSMDIKTSAHALLGIINDILDFSKIESGKMGIVPAEYQFNSMLNDLYNIFSLRTQEKGLRFDVSVDSSLPSKLYGDDLRIRQVLVNLLTNAVKYTRKGTVSFEVTGERDGADVVLHFAVRDTGIGIRQVDIPKLFSAFERIDEEKNRNIEGTGLGMNISLQLLKLMDTDLHVESVYGEGTRFFFALRQGVVNAEPIGSFQERARKAAKEHSYHASFTSPEGEILLVDDNRVNRRVFCGLLKQTQVKITDVGSGRECLDHIRQKHYDIIFLDHMMPEMDGMETMQRMKEMEDNLCKETPVIMLTANAIMGAKEQYLAAGFDDFLAKPIDQTKLERLMMHWMPQEKIHSNI